MILFYGFLHGAEVEWHRCRSWGGDRRSVQYPFNWYLVNQIFLLEVKRSTPWIGLHSAFWHTSSPHISRQSEVATYLVARWQFAAWRFLIMNCAISCPTDTADGSFEYCSTQRLVQATMWPKGFLPHSLRDRVARMALQMSRSYHQYSGTKSALSIKNNTGL